MTHLGDFGTPRDAVDATFGWFGATLRVNPDLADIAVFEVFAATNVENVMAVSAALQTVAIALVHPDDIDEFWRLAKANRQTMDDIANVAMHLISVVAERPTRLPSDSSAGQPPDATRSEDDSSSRALRRLDGRPDLQVVLVRDQEQRSA